MHPAISLWSPSTQPTKVYGCLRIGWFYFVMMFEGGWFLPSAFLVSCGFVPSHPAFLVSPSQRCAPAKVELSESETQRFSQSCWVSEQSLCTQQFLYEAPQPNLRKSMDVLGSGGSILWWCLKADGKNHPPFWFPVASFLRIPLFWSVHRRDARLPRLGWAKAKPNNSRNHVGFLSNRYAPSNFFMKPINPTYESLWMSQDRVVLEKIKSLFQLYWWNYIRLL